MPIDSSLLVEASADADGGTTQGKPEFEKLGMPSEVEPARRCLAAMKELAEKETLLQEAEARDVLHQVGHIHHPSCNLLT